MNQYHLFQLCKCCTLKSDLLLYNIAIAGGKLNISKGKQFFYLLLVSEIFLGIRSGFDNIICTAAGAAGDPGPLNTVPTNTQVIYTGVCINIFSS